MKFASISNALFLNSLFGVSDALYQVFYIHGDPLGDGFNGKDGDATIFLNEPDQAAGGANLVIGCDGIEDCARSLLRFDVSTMPSDAVITDVKLALVPRNTGSEDDPEVLLDMHQLTSNWTRTTTSTNSGPVSGNTATEGDVTWKYSSYPSTEWDALGGDVDANILSSVTSISGSRNTVFFESSDSFANVVQGWIDGSIPNYGVLVKRNTEVVNEMGFHEFFNEQSGNKPRRSPKLLVQYTSESEPEQQPSNPSGPGIVLPNEPTPVPATPRPTNANTCPIDAASTLVHFVTSDHSASLLEDQADISVDKGTFAVGISRNGARRGLVRFPLDTLPNNAVITCAEIILSPTGPCSPCQHNTDIHMYAMAKSWSTTGTNTWLEQPDESKHSEVELMGKLANTGDTTWEYSSYNSANPADGTLWDKPGGDFEEPIISSELDYRRAKHMFPTNDAFVSLLQDMFDGKKANNGFIFMTEESDEYRAQVAEENTYKDHDSAYSVFYSEDAEDEGNRPLLVLHYEVMSSVPGISLCFSGKSTVETASGDVVPMKDIRIGDLVKVAENSFERVYGFGHFDATSKGNYIVINQGIELSEDHLLHIHGKGFVPAGSVVIGDMMISASGANVAVKSLGSKDSVGMYAPFTPSGKIVVNGIIASSFTTIQPGLASIAISGYSTGIPHAWAAHKFEFVHRLVCHYLNKCPNESYTKDGVSTWVSEPRKMFNWLLEQNVILAFGIMIPIFSLFVVFALLEGLFTAPLGGIVVAFVVIGATVSCKLRKNKAV